MRLRYQWLAMLIHARKNTINGKWLVNEHEEKILQCLRDTAPRGSGINCGTQIDFDKSTGEKLVFIADFQHSVEHGSHTEWTHHTITVTPSLMDTIKIKISGPNRNDVKEYLHDCFHTWLWYCP